MTTPARIWIPYGFYHITSRGSRRANIFVDDVDFITYLGMMRNTIIYYENKFNIICYCLMNNHFHILLEAQDMHYKNFMTRLGSMYASYFYNRHQITGNLFQGRYYSELMKSNAQVFETTRYIHLNPVRAKIVTRPEEYDWSSYATYIGHAEEKLIDSSRILYRFGSREAYKSFVEHGIK